jgi:hypothetical protein
VNEISRLRFDTLAGYSRAPATVIVAEERGWFEESRERVLGVLFRDRIDDDYGYVVMARDRKGRFRAVDVDCSVATEGEARDELAERLVRWAGFPDERYYQADEAGRPLDLFTPVLHEDALDPNFVALASTEGYSPAREVIASMMHYFHDPDGNFVEQFQTTGFDARIWELYLFAALTELGYAFDRSHSAPDFLCRGMRGEFFVEAVTVNPTTRGGHEVPPPNPESVEAMQAYLQEYVPIKYGSALFAKLQKRYWTLPHIGDRAIVFAVQDFHRLRSMTWSHSSLVDYLYGIRHSWHHDERGQLVITPERIVRHRWKNKEIPSGFFFLAGAEHVSAVLANPHGTMTKFNRIGFLAGHGSRRVIMIRTGTRYRDDPNADAPLAFEQRVNDPTFSETWCEGLSVFYNPRALHPVHPEQFPGAAQHFLEGERVVSYLPAFHPYGSMTAILMPTDD